MHAVQLVPFEIGGGLNDLEGLYCPLSPGRFLWFGTIWFLQNIFISFKDESSPEVRAVQLRSVWA